MSVPITDKHVPTGQGRTATVANDRKSKGGREPLLGKSVVLAPISSKTELDRV